VAKPGNRTRGAAVFGAGRTPESGFGAEAASIRPATGMGLRSVTRRGPEAGRSRDTRGASFDTAKAHCI